MTQATTSDFVEGIRIRTAPAPLLKRAMAGFIDVGIVTGAFYIAFLILILLGTFLGVAFFVFIDKLKNAISDRTAGIVTMIGVAVFLLVIVLGMMAIWHLYFIYFEYKRGATPGKRIMGLRVVSGDGGPITKGQAIYRDLVRWYIDYLFFLPAIVSIACTKNKQRVGDLLANTIVVHSVVSEERQRFMYVKREDYMALKDHLQPRPVPNDAREKYLHFASRALLMGEPNETLQKDWLAYIRSHLERSEALGLNDFTVLRFFAELCFQEEYEAKEGKAANGGQP